MKLSDRLETIVSLVPRTAAGGCVADVGTDHGFVPIRLVELKKAERVLAMDVRKGPLQRAEEHIRQRGMEGQIQTRLSDGLKELKRGEAETVVIAGMGGELMLRLLREAGHVRDSIGTWILSPQSELEQFRRGLEELNLRITGEVMLKEDGKYYVVMVAKPGSMHYEQAYEYRYGQCLIRKHDPVLGEYLEREKTKFAEIQRQLEAQNTEKSRQRLDELKQEMKQTEEAYHAMQSVD